MCVHLLVFIWNRNIAVLFLTVSPLWHENIISNHFFTMLIQLFMPDSSSVNVFWNYHVLYLYTHLHSEHIYFSSFLSNAFRFSASGSNTSFLSFLFHYSLYVTIPQSSSHLFWCKTGSNLLFLKAITIGSNFSGSISDSPLQVYKFKLWLMGINQAITDVKWF